MLLGYMGVSFFRHTRFMPWSIVGLACALCLLASCGGSGHADNSIPGIEVDESYFHPDNEVEIKEREHKSDKRVFNSSEEMISFMNDSKDAARYRSGILMQMAKDAPRYADSLLNSHHPRFLVVDKAKMRVMVFDSCGNLEKSFKMACAKKYGNKHKKGDSRTPEGYFQVEGVYDSTEWLFTDDDGVTSDVKGQYGPRFIRVKTSPTRWPIGIHGTNAPWSVGGRRSHGCIRLSNDDIMELVELVEKGMPIIISPSKKDMQVNYEEGTPTLRIWTGGDPLTEFKPQEPKEETKDTIPVSTTENLDDSESTSSETTNPNYEEPATEEYYTTPERTSTLTDSIP